MLKKHRIKAKKTLSQVTRTKDRGVDFQTAKKPLQYLKKTNITYKKDNIRNEDASDLFHLDLYYHQDGRKNKPVIVFVHGGGWVKGDKSNIEKNPGIIDFFISRGYILACINFRLILNDESPGTTYMDQAEDIAFALKWLFENIKKYGGKHDSFVLLGYSSGAHLVSLVSLDQRYLADKGLNAGIIKAVIAMDVHAYDIPSALQLMKGTPLVERIPMIIQIFGEDRIEQLEASPINYVSSPFKLFFLIISAGRMYGHPQKITKHVSRSFTMSLERHGHGAVHAHFDSRSHVSLVLDFAQPGDEIAETIEEFLEATKSLHDKALTLSLTRKQ